MVCHDVFPTCQAEMLPTLPLKTWRLPVLTRSDQVRSLMFMTGWFPFKYSRFVCTAHWEVVFMCLNTTDWEVLLDKMGTV